MKTNCGNIENKDLIITTDIYNMKRYIIALFFIIFCSVLSAQVFTSVNAQYDCAYKLKNETTKAGWDTQLIYKLSAYWFPNDNPFGVFSYVGGRMFPQTTGLLFDKKVTDYLIVFTPCIGIGAGFKYPITQKVMLKTGIAASIDFQILQTEHKSYNYEVKGNEFTMTFGITNDIGVKYMLSKNIYIDFGAVLGLWYTNYTYRKYIYSDKPTDIKNDWEKKYFKFSAAPFAGLGLKLPL